MMTNIELCKAMYTSFESGDMETWRTLVSANCVLVTDVTQPLVFAVPQKRVEWL